MWRGGWQDDASRAAGECARDTHEQGNNSKRIEGKRRRPAQLTSERDAAAAVVVVGVVTESGEEKGGANAFCVSVRRERQEVIGTLVREREGQQAKEAETHTSRAGAAAVAQEPTTHDSTP